MVPKKVVKDGQDQTEQANGSTPAEQKKE